MPWLLDFCHVFFGSFAELTKDLLYSVRLPMFQKLKATLVSSLLFVVAPSH